MTCPSSSGWRERLQGVAPELRQLVEEEDAVVGQARLARTRRAAAADQAGGADAGVRAAEGAQADQARGRLLGRLGVDLGDLDRLRQGERRQEAGEAPGEHRLAGARGADEEEVVAARRGDLQGSLGGLLAAHLREVGDVVGDVRGEGRWGDRRESSFAEDVPDRLGEAAEADDRDGAQGGGLGGVGGGEEDLADSQALAEVRDRQAAADRADGSIQAQLAAEEPAGEGFFRDLAVRGEEGEGDRQVEVVAFLAEVGGGEVDDDRLGREVVAAVLDRGADPLAALADRGVGEPHDLHLWEAELDVDFDLDGSGFDAPGCGCDGSG